MLIDFFEGVFEAFQTIIDRLMLFLPLGLIALTAASVGEFNSSTIGAMSRFVLAATIVLGGVTAIAVVIVWRRQGGRLIDAYVALRHTLIFAFATQNSFASLPSAMEALRLLGFSDDVADLVGPLAITTCRLGAVGYIAVSSVFVAQIYGAALGPSDLVLIVVGSVIAGLATAGTDRRRAAQPDRRGARPRARAVRCRADSVRLDGRHREPAAHDLHRGGRHGDGRADRANRPAAGGHPRANGRRNVNPWLSFVGIGLGVAIGLWSQPAGIALGYVGDIYTRLLDLCIVPMLVTLVITSVAKLRDSRVGKRLARPLVIVVACAVLAAAAIPMLLGLAIDLGSRLSPSLLLALGRYVHVSSAALQMSLGAVQMQADPRPPLYALFLSLSPPTFSRPSKIRYAASSWCSRLFSGSASRHRANVRGAVSLRCSTSSLQDFVGSFGGFWSSYRPA